MGPAAAGGDPVKHNVDAVVVREGRLFAYGWAYDPSRPLRELALQISYSDGTHGRLPVMAGKERADVAATFPSEPLARWSGWMAYAGWDRPAKCIELTGRLDDGESFSLPVHRRIRPSPSQRVRQLARAVLARIERGPANRQTPLLSTLRTALDAAGLERLCLILDHGMGGGANKFRADWVRARLTQLPLLVVVGFEVHRMAWWLDLHLATGQVIRLPWESDLPQAMADAGLVGEVFVNDAVSYPHPGRVPDWLKAWAGAGADVTVAVHDYLSICPSPFLLNDTGRYCGVPSLTECQRCMKANPNTFPAVQPGPDMVAWRTVWGEALAQARQVLCFSESSRRLMLRAYPFLASRIAVMPHSVEPFPRGISIATGGALHVGVVGAIGFHKGSDVLHGLAAEAVRRGVDLHLTVFGTLEGRTDERLITVTGPYKRDELPGLIERSGVNLFLLPSICPETFSYVTHELVGLGVSLACFDLGAPADRIAQYPLGRVLPLTDSAQLLDDLASFHQDIQRTSSREGT